MSLFGIKTPHLYRCQVYRYFNGLSRLYLSVSKPPQTAISFFLLFSDVGYFEGPMNWQSIDFQIAPYDQCIDLMLRTGLVGEAILQFPDAYASITESVQLYVVDTPNLPVRIIAGSAALLPDLPASL
jgi:hypothetical protein